MIRVPPVGGTCFLMLFLEMWIVLLPHFGLRYNKNEDLSNKVLDKDKREEEDHQEVVQRGTKLLMKRSINDEI